VGRCCRYLVHRVIVLTVQTMAAIVTGSLGMHRFFQGVTVLWASVLLLLAIGLGTLLATMPVGIYVPVWAVTTIALIADGIGVSV
jgi:hypothetical protein